MLISVGTLVKNSLTKNAKISDLSLAKPLLFILFNNTNFISKNSIFMNYRCIFFITFAGQYTLLGAKMNRRVVAVEASIKHVQMLQRAVMMNK